jgi:hypothetical protein
MRDAIDDEAHCWTHARQEQSATFSLQSQWVMVTGTGFDAMPFATTTSVLFPGGVRRGSVNSVIDAAPGAVENVVQLCVRA